MRFFIAVLLVAACVLPAGSQSISIASSDALGFPNVPPQALTLVFPNGGERFGAGADTTIVWTGIPLSTPVTLEYSTDGGASWKLIASGVSGGSYHWHVPRAVSSSCLVRVSTSSGGNTGDSVVVITSKIMSSWFDWSPNGDEIATAAWDSTLRIINSWTGAVNRSASVPNISSMAWSPDGKTLAAGLGGGKVALFDAVTLKEIREFQDHSIDVWDLAWSPDGSKLLETSFDYCIAVRDITNNKLITTICPAGKGNSFPMHAAWSPDGTKIVSGGSDFHTNDQVMIWNATTGVLIGTPGLGSDHWAVDWSSQNQILAVNDGGSGVIVSDPTGANAVSFQTPRGQLLCGSFSPDGSQILVGNSTNFGVTTCLQSYSVSTQQVTRQFLELKNGAYSARFSPDGTRVAAYDAYDTFYIWNGHTHDTATAQQDVSDAKFSIVMPLDSSQDIDMGSVLVSASKDSIVQTFVRNNGNVSFRVNSIAFTGANASEFSLVSGIPPFDVAPGTSHPVEFRFSPAGIGLRTARILLTTQSDTLQPSIQGTGVMTGLSMQASVIDFGDVPIGSYKDTTITQALKNTGSTNIDFTGTSMLGANTTDFSVQSGGGIFTLSPGEVRQVTLRFSPHVAGPTSGEAAFDFNDPSSPAVLQLFGRGTDVNIRILNDSGFAGDRRYIPLVLRGALPLSVLAVTKNFLATIAYDKTVLSPLDRNNIKPGKRFDTLVVKGVLPADSILSQVGFESMLGMSDSTVLTITSFAFTDALDQPGTFAANVSNGVFHVLGICNQGGPRLINPDGAVAITSISPNPANGMIHAVIHTIESGPTELALTNALGQTVLTLMTQDDAPGVHAFEIDSRQLATGQYFIVLRTPTVERVAGIEITK